MVASILEISFQHVNVAKLVRDWGQLMARGGLTPT